MRLAVALLFAVLAVPGGAGAQSEPPPDAGVPIVLVVDGAAGRLSVTRLRRTLEAVLGRAIVRPTDASAAGAPSTLTIAFSRPRRWVVRFDEGTAHPSRSLDVSGPALETLVGLAVLVVGEARAAEPASPRGEAAPAPASGTPSVRLVGEIIDPFAGIPVSRIAIAVVGELIDPFARGPAGVRVITSPEVLDPWR